MSKVLKPVEDASLKATPTGCEMKLRFQWYRSLPVSCVENLKLSLDGQPVNSDQLRFGVNGHQYRVDELADKVEEFWFVQDSAVLSVAQSERWNAGETHRIDLEFAMRAPYIPIGQGNFLTKIHKYSADQVVQ
jgi:hypothetical protein